MTTQDRWLLPEGIEELLPAEARRVESLRRAILDLFSSWGYDLVMPPLIEFLDSLLTGVGKDMDLQTFKLTDQLTGRMMGVRPDMTPQAARIDSHYLKRNAPMRLCYLGSVLRTRPDEFGGSREPLQLGAELFGHSGPESDAEILGLMIATLDLAGIRNPHIDLGHVGVFRALAAQAQLGAETEAELFDALQRKSRGEAETLLSACRANDDVKQMLLALFDLNGGTEVLGQARQRFTSAPPAVRHALDELQSVVRLVGAQSTDLPLYFDLAELSGYHYYTGVVFSAFVPGHGRALAQGGRYDGIGRAFGRDRAATGFGADLRQLLKFSLRTENGRAAILAPDVDDNDLWKEVARLRASGQRVVMQLPGDRTAPKLLGCDRVLVKAGGGWVVEKAQER